MSGRKRHFIPRSYLGAFRSERTGSTPHIWMYRRGAPVCEPSIFDVAAKRDFYEDSVDDQITKYEGELAARLQRIREMPVGAVVDAGLAAEIVTHLTVRTAHLRHTFEGGVKTLIGELGRRADDPMRVRQLLKLDYDVEDSPLLTEIDNLLNSDPTIEQFPVPKRVLRRVFRVCARENFDAAFPEMRPSLSAAINGYAAILAVGIRAGHNKVLSSGMAPPKRVDHMAGFVWRLVDGPPEGLIVPDCVAIARVADGSYLPLTGGSLSDVLSVYLPISPHVLMVGESNGGGSSISIEEMNLALARASHHFFLSSRHGNGLVELASSIGMCASTGIEEAVSEALAGIDPDTAVEADAKRSSPAPESRGNDERSDGGEEEEAIFVPFPVTLDGWGDESTAERRKRIVGHFLDAARRMMPVDRIAGVTLAVDCESVRQRLAADHGTAGGPYRYDRSYPFNDASVTFVYRDGRVDGHFVFSAEFAQGWLDADEATARRAFAIFLRLAAEIARIQVLADALAGSFVINVPDELGGVFAPYIDRIWSAYCGSRFSAFVDPSLSELHAQLLSGALNRARQNIPEAHLRFQKDGDLRRLFDATLCEVDYILQHCSELIGHRDGLREESAGPRSELDALNESKLTKWYDLLANDLRRLWDRAGLWTSTGEFKVLGDHVDRLLWGYGLVLERTDGGDLRAYPFPPQQAQEATPTA